MNLSVEIVDIPQFCIPLAYRVVYMYLCLIIFFSCCGEINLLQAFSSLRPFTTFPACLFSWSHMCISSDAVYLFVHTQFFIIISLFFWVKQHRALQHGNITLSGNVTWLIPIWFSLEQQNWVCDCGGLSYWLHIKNTPNRILLVQTWPKSDIDFSLYWHLWTNCLGQTEFL